MKGLVGSIMASFWFTFNQIENIILVCREEIAGLLWNKLYQKGEPVLIISSLMVLYP
jgi:hypothetical protein